MHLEAITSETKKILERLKVFPEFYLAGGTGLALQIGHRISVDFDLFSEKPLASNLLSKIEKEFEGFNIEIIENQPRQLNVIINDVNLSFIEYPFLIKYIKDKDLEINIAPITEIAAMKAYAIGRRTTLKDYIDLYFIIKDRLISLKKLIELCEKKYGGEFNARLLLGQLVYSRDIEAIEIAFLKDTVTKETIESFFEKKISNILEK